MPPADARNTTVLPVVTVWLAGWRVNAGATAVAAVPSSIVYPSASDT